MTATTVYTRDRTDPTERGHALIKVMAGPELLCDHLTVSEQSVWDVLDGLRLAQQIGDPGRQIALASRAADLAAGRMNTEAVDAALPLEEELGVWARIVEEFGRLGLKLDQPHVAAASAVIDDAAAGKLSTADHQEWAEDRAEIVATAIGKKVPPMHRVDRGDPYGRPG